MLATKPVLLRSREDETRLRRVQCLMEVSECVLSAARAVLDLVEREWQPLSPGELEQRLDQAVEEILEAELMAGIKTRPPPALYVHLPQNRTGVHPRSPAASTSRPPEEGTPEAAEARQDVGAAAVKRITELLQTSESSSRLAGRARLSLSQTIQLALTLLTERVSYRSVSRRFHLEKGNIHRIFFSFCERINALEESLIRWPVGAAAAEALVPLWRSEKDEEQQDGVPGVLAVLGHTRISIRLPVGQHVVQSTAAEVKRIKKEAHPDSWLNLELVCDRRGRFLHCRVSKGSDVDRGGALRDKLQQHPELMVPGSVIVAPAGFLLSPHILTPYNEIDGEKEELFNRTLAEHQKVLVQAVANLKARFPRLRYLDIGNYERARAVVLTACVLHNVLLDVGQEVHGEVEEEEDVSGEEDGDEDEEGAQKRDGVSELLFRTIKSGDKL